MKIACIGYFHGEGGAEKQLILLSNELLSRGHEVHLICIFKNNIRFDLNKSVIVHDLTSSEKIKGNIILNRYKYLKLELEKINPDVTINFWLQSAYLTVFMPKDIRGKVLYSERGDPSDDEYSGLLGVIRYFTFKLIDGIVFQSSGAKNYFGKSVDKKSVVISNPVYIPSEKFCMPSDNRTKKLVTVGRLHKQKNQELLIRSFSKIAKKFPEYKLEIYGDGELKNELQNLINNLNLDSRVHLMGTKSNIFDYIYNSSLFILTSNYEGLPNALLEAMSLGIPCISTDCKPGGAREIINNEIDGIIVPREDEISLTNVIQYSIEHPDIMEIMAKNAMNNMKRFKPETIYDKWEQFLSELISE